MDKEGTGLGPSPFTAWHIILNKTYSSWNLNFHVCVKEWQRHGLLITSYLGN